MDTRQKMKEFMDRSECLDTYAVAGLVGINSNLFNAWLEQKRQSKWADFMAGIFLEGDGAKLLAIQEALQNGSKNRFKLHQQRSEILKKAKARPTTNQRVPSPTVA